MNASKEKPDAFLKFNEMITEIARLEPGCLETVQKLKWSNETFDSMLAEKTAEIDRLNTVNLAYSNEVSLSEREIERLQGQIDVRDSVISKLSGTVAEWRPLLNRAIGALAIDGHDGSKKNCQSCAIYKDLINGLDSSK